MARVVMVGNFGLTKKGTIRARALPLARALVRRGHEVTIILPARDEPPKNFSDAGVQVRYVDAQGPSSLRLALIAVGMIRAALSLRPFAVHAFKPISFAALTAGAAWLAGRLRLLDARLVVDTDDWEGTGGWATFEGRPGWLRWLIDRQEQWTLRHAAAVTVASRHLEVLVARLGISSKRIHYLPNGAESADGGQERSLRTAMRLRLGIADGLVLLLYTRFFEYPLERVADVFAGVAARVPRARLLVVGRGFRGEEHRLAAALAERGLTDRVVFAGWVAAEELPAYFAAADAALYPLSDTLLNRTKCPAKLVELMAAGIPVVAEAVGQANEYIVAGESGLLVPSGDEESFARLLVGLLMNEALREDLGRGAVARIREYFLWEHLAEVAERAYGLADGTTASQRASYVQA